jgi:hypothetical protein
VRLPIDMDSWSGCPIDMDSSCGSSDIDMDCSCDMLIPFLVPYLRARSVYGPVLNPAPPG